MKRSAVFTLTLCSAGNILFAEADKAGSGPATDGRTEKLLELRERIHGILEKRFFSSENILYDYAGPNGEVVIPSAEECLANKPNAFAWNTPIENGGFFNGDLLAGLCDLYEKFPSEKLAKQMRTLARGLYVLQDKSPVKGCIIRGIGSDGKSFYPASSTDQVIPFLLGLWRYSQSKASTPEEKADCRRRCRETALALKQNHWIVLGARKGFNRGNIANKSQARAEGAQSGVGTLATASPLTPAPPCSLRQGSPGLDELPTQVTTCTCKMTLAAATNPPSGPECDLVTFK